MTPFVTDLQDQVVINIASEKKANGESSSLADIQAKLHQANEEKGASGNDMTTLQQEEEMSISGSNARLMVMQKLSRKPEVFCTLYYEVEHCLSKLDPLSHWFSW